MKKYVDADKVINATSEVPKELWEYETLMKKKLNFDKSKEAKKRKINKKFKYKK